MITDDKITEIFCATDEFETQSVRHFVILSPSLLPSGCFQAMISGVPCSKLMVETATNTPA